MRKVLMAVLLAMAVATPVSAQSPGGGGQDGFKPNLAGEGRKMKTVDDWQAEQDREKAYKSGMSKIPDQKVENRPVGHRASPCEIAPVHSRRSHFRAVGWNSESTISQRCGFFPLIDPWGIAGGRDEPDMVQDVLLS